MSAGPAGPVVSVEHHVLAQRNQVAPLGAELFRRRCTGVSEGPIGLFAERFGLSAVGFILGAGGTTLFITCADFSALSGGFLPATLAVTPRILGLAALVAVALGIVSSLAPSVSVARLSVVEGLTTLD